MPPEQPGRPRWLSVIAGTYGTGSSGLARVEVSPLPKGFAPGQRVTVMPAEDAAEMLALLERLARDVPRLIQPSKLEQDAHALLSRLRGRR